MGIVDDVISIYYSDRPSRYPARILVEKPGLRHGNLKHFREVLRPPRRTQDDTLIEMALLEKGWIGRKGGNWTETKRPIPFGTGLARERELVISKLCAEVWWPGRASAS